MVTPTGLQQACDNKGLALSNRAKKPDSRTLGPSKLSNLLKLAERAKAADACRCVDVAMGSYGNQETLIFPFPTERFPVVGTKRVCIDRCILPMIEHLWALGIETRESCCGHGEPALAYIAVMPGHERAMHELGFERHQRRLLRDDLFAWPAPNLGPCLDGGASG